MPLSVSNSRAHMNLYIKSPVIWLAGCHHASEVRVDCLSQDQKGVKNRSYFGISLHSSLCTYPWTGFFLLYKPKYNLDCSLLKYVLWNCVTFWVDTLKCEHLFSYQCYMAVGTAKTHSWLFVIVYSDRRVFGRFNHSWYITVGLKFCCWLKQVTWYLF